MRAPAAAALLLLAASASAADPPGHEGALGPYPMAREASGTSWQPEASGMEGVRATLGSWRLMAHASAFGLFTDQGGPRGGEQAFVTNMAMAAATRAVGRGTLTFRAMGSLEPLMGPRGYRLLLQTGETADGRTHLVDRQHPHDAAMELAAVYARPLGARSSLFAYVGCPGEPAVGPPAFMHRASAELDPIAPLSHHWLDSTHIAYGVATLGLAWGPLKLDGSAFNGHEPDARRWNLERPRFDSWSARVTVNPRPSLSVQASLAELRGPEILHPTIDVRRYTASVAYGRAEGAVRPQAMLAWGRNVRSADLPTSCPLLATREAAAACAIPGPPYAPSRTADALLAEVTLRLGGSQAVFVRGERVEKDELFPSFDPFHVRVFPVGTVLAGYRYERGLGGRLSAGIGASGGVTLVPEFLANEYGARPLSYWLFLLARLR